MHRDERSSAADSAETSKPPVTPAPEKTSSEQDYLARQTVEARGAARQVLRDLGRDALHDIDPRTWIRSHPWATVGGVSAAFVAAAVVISSKRHRSNPHHSDGDAPTWWHAPRHSNGDAPKADPADPADPNKSDDPDDKSIASLVWRMSGHFLRIFEPVIASTLASVVTAWTTPAQKPNPAPDDSYDSGSAPSKE